MFNMIRLNVVCSEIANIRECAYANMKMWGEFRSKRKQKNTGHDMFSWTAGVGHVSVSRLS